MNDLEKVEADFKEYRENSIEQDKAYQECIDRQGAKIEAIKKWFEDNKHENITWDNWKELKKLLGAEGPETDLQRFYRVIYAFIDPDNKPALLLPDTVIQIIGKWKEDAESWAKMLAVMGPLGAKIFVDALVKTYDELEEEGSLVA